MSKFNTKRKRTRTIRTLKFPEIQYGIKSRQVFLQTGSWYEYVGGKYIWNFFTVRGSEEGVHSL